MLKDVSNAALKESLTGLEFSCGIPGTIGGAVFMNAGAYNGEISQVIESAEIIDNENNIRTSTTSFIESKLPFSSLNLADKTI